MHIRSLLFVPALALALAACGGGGAGNQVAAEAMARIRAEEGN